MKPVYLEEPTPITEGLASNVWSTIVTNPETEWLVEDLIPVGKQVQLYSPSGIGKSLLALHIAICVAEGTPTFGQLFTKQGVVLYMDYENGPSIMKERVESYGYQGDDMLWFQDKIYPVLYPDIASLETEEAAQIMETTLNETKADLVVIDSMGLAFNGEENSADSYKGFGRNMGRLFRERNTAVLMLDNTGKDTTRGARGSSRKKDEADLQWMFKETSADTYQLTSMKDRLGASPKALAISKFQDPYLHWKMTTKRPVSEAAKRIIKAMVTAGVTPTSVNDARNKGVTGKQRYLAEAIKTMKAAHSSDSERGNGEG